MIITPEVIVEESNYVYCSDENGTAQIWLNKTSGNSLVTDSGNSQHVWPRISPNESSLLYYKISASDDIQDPTSAKLIRHIIRSGEEFEVIDNTKYAWRTHGSANWSHDGNRIVMTAVEDSSFTNQIFVCFTDGSDAIRVSKRSDYDYYHPVFSLDDQFVYCAVVPSDLEPSNENTEIHRISIETGEEERLTFNSTADFHPCINNDEKILVFESLLDVPVSWSWSLAIAKIEHKYGRRAAIIKY